MLQEGVMRFAVWAQGDFRDEVTGGLARLDLTGHGAHTPGGSNPSTPGATPTTPSGGFSTAQPRSRTNTTHRPDIRKGTPRHFTSNFSIATPSSLFIRFTKSIRLTFLLFFSNLFFFLFLTLTFVDVALLRDRVVPLRFVCLRGDLFPVKWKLRNDRNSIKNC